uniref:Calaxin n=1 Tax=Myripristis murdjan TaxID=586833 RepID=A0A668AKS2_9TELE
MPEMSALNKKLTQTLAETISKQVKHFNKRETECLIRLCNGLLGDQTVSIHNSLLLLVYLAVFHTFDKDSDGYISVKEWIEGLSVFLRGTLDEKIKYCFAVYDLNSDGYISREEMLQMLNDSMIREPTEEDPDEGIKDLVEITFKRMDYDHDGRLSYADFERAVREENLLLEAFGSCLPDAESTLVFEEQAFKDPPGQ